ncbi:MAG: sulfatase-like hydrolase/transferase [Bacteroidia bacterium]|nr:sulfatase-like hydrolase/transferase [Bacteroidia bacterium]
MKKKAFTYFFREEKILSFLHLPLLLLFFILYSWKQSLYFFSLPEAFLFWLAGTIGFLLLVLALNLLIFNNLAKASASVSFAGIVFLHYSTLYKFISENPTVSEMGRHRFLVPLFLILWGIGMYYLHFHQKEPRRLTRYLNLLFLILVTGEIFQVIVGYGQWYEGWKELKEKYVNAPALAVSAKRDSFPDIVHIIVDAHTSFESLEKFWDYSPSLREFFRQNNFYIAEKARSNYDHTGQSISSLFAGDSIPLLHTMNVESHLSNATVLELISHGKIPRSLMKQGYQIINYSFFDLPGAPRSRQNPFISHPVRTGKFLWSKTLGGKLQSDFFQKPTFQSDQETVELLKNISFSDYDSPVFVYAHLVIPHAPYFFDEKGKNFPDGHPPGKEDHEAYRDQLIYTDQKLTEIVTALLRDPTRQPVIIIQGDHGSRILPDPEENPTERFTILNAFYFPDGDYTLLDDSLTTRETYPVVWEKYFTNP